MEKQKVSVHSSENRRFSYKSLLKTQKQKQQVDFWIRKNTIFLEIRMTFRLMHVLPLCIYKIGNDQIIYDNHCRLYSDLLLNRSNYNNLKTI